MIEIRVLEVWFSDIFGWNNKWIIIKRVIKNLGFFNGFWYCWIGVKEMGVDVSIFFI